MGIALSSPYLDKPSIEKITEHERDDELSWAVSSMQGWRRNMEDSHVARKKVVENNQPFIFAVFDGHGGKEVALFAEKYFPEEIVKLDCFKEGDYGKAIGEAFHRIDSMIPTTEYKDEISSYRHPEDREIDNHQRSEAGEEDESGNKPKVDPALEKLFSIVKQLSDEEKKKKVIDENTGMEIEVEEEDDENSETTENKIEELKDEKTIDNTVGENTESEEATSEMDVEKNKLEEDKTDYSEYTEMKEEEKEEDKPTKPYFMNPEMVCQLPDHNVQAGCTAVVTIIDKEYITVGWAGDSRVVLCKAGEAIGLSIDHKPNDTIERTRIEKAGGFVQNISGQHRVNGNLNLSRALGDLKYKQNTSISVSEQIITAEPDITKTKREPDHEFAIIACDGIWDVMSNQQACDFVRPRLVEDGTSPEAIAKIVEDMLDACVSVNPTETRGIGCDNMTCIVLSFKDKIEPSPKATSVNAEAVANE